MMKNYTKKCTQFLGICPLHKKGLNPWSSLQARVSHSLKAVGLNPSVHSLPSGPLLGKNPCQNTLDDPRAH